MDSSSLTFSPAAPDGGAAREVVVEEELPRTAGTATLRTPAGAVPFTPPVERVLVAVGRTVPPVPAERTDAELPGRGTPDVAALGRAEATVGLRAPPAAVEGGREGLTVRTGAPEVEDEEGSVRPLEMLDLEVWPRVEEEGGGADLEVLTIPPLEPAGAAEEEEESDARRGRPIVDAEMEGLRAAEDGAEVVPDVVEAGEGRVRARFAGPPAAEAAVGAVLLAVVAPAGLRTPAVVGRTPGLVVEEEVPGGGLVEPILAVVPAAGAAVVEGAAVGVGEDDGADSGAGEGGESEEGCKSTMGTGGGRSEVVLDSSCA